MREWRASCQLKRGVVIHHGGFRGTLLLLAAADNRINPVFVRQFSVRPTGIVKQKPICTYSWMKQSEFMIQVRNTSEYCLLYT